MRLLADIFRRLTLAIKISTAFRPPRSPPFSYFMQFSTDRPGEAAPQHLEHFSWCLFAATTAGPKAITLTQCLWCGGGGLYVRKLCGFEWIPPDIASTYNFPHERVSRFAAIEYITLAALPTAKPLRKTASPHLELSFPFPLPLVRSRP